MDQWAIVDWKAYSLETGKLTQKKAGKDKGPAAW